MKDMGGHDQTFAGLFFFIFFLLSLTHPLDRLQIRQVPHSSGVSWVWRLTHGIGENYEFEASLGLHSEF